MNSNFTFSGRHKNKVNRKVIILAVIMAAVLGLNVFMFAGKGFKFKKPAPHSAVDQKKVDSAVQALAAEKETLRMLAKGLGINACSREAEFSRTDISFYLYNRISALSEKQGVSLASFSPGQREEKDGVTRISFLGEISGGYPEMVNFFRELERTERLFINDLTVTSAPDAPLVHRAQFTVSCFAMNDELLKNVMLSAQAFDTPPTEPEDKGSTVTRDPFFQKLEAAMAVRVDKDKKGEAASAGAGVGLDLTGIVGYPVPTAAIINHEIVHIGDIVQGKEVREIKPDEVILQDGDQAQILRLPKAGPFSSGEENPLSLSDLESQR